MRNDAMKPPGRGKKNTLVFPTYLVLHRKRKQTNSYGGKNIKKTAGPAPLTNQMMDSLEGYLDNYSVVATQTAATGGPLAELAASLEISVDTVSRHKQEIKRFYEQINALKKRGTQATSDATFPVGKTVCTHCEAVSCTAPHRKNTCYFDPCKMTDQKYWAIKLMDEKVVACKGDE